MTAAVDVTLGCQGAAMILSAIAEKLRRRSKDDFKGRHFQASLILQAMAFKPDAIDINTPKEGGTEVSWAMSGTHTFVNKLFTIFMDLDKFVAPQFEEGLANLGKVAATDGEKRLSTEA